MSITPETETKHHDDITHVHPHPKKRSVAAFAVGAIAILAVGVAGGAGAMKLTQPKQSLRRLSPSPSPPCRMTA